MKLSIIIPVYKAERWIGRCLESIFNQHVDSNFFEVICVVDGSPDESSSVIRGFQQRYQNIILIEQENKGVSSARNKALSVAKGDFICFMDSDDILPSNVLELIIEDMSDSKDEVVVCRSFTANTELFSWIHLFKSGVSYTPFDVINSGYIRGSVWGCYYNKNFLLKNKILFPENISNGEDSFFFFMCLYFANEIRFADIKMYEVIEEGGSLSRTFNKERINKTISSLRIIDNKLSGYPFISDKQFVFQYLWYSFISSLVYNVIKTEGVCYRTLMKSAVTKYTHFKIDNRIKFLRIKMQLMKSSFLMYYFLTWIKYKVAKV